MKKLQEVIVRPLVTERSTALAEKSKYSFEVHSNATKQEIRDAVESMFKKEKVEVAKVNTANVPAKVRRFGRNQSQSYRWKKAIVTLKPGQKIEFFEGA
ncbi:MAG TPA: 50S ribosomal protein L23 [bacterium]|nr:50S ribosomal protein L23 [bacterium]